VAGGHVYVTAGNALLAGFGIEREGPVMRLGVPDCP
jgi:polyvinyl alcohol dehydrogenase (cytochrome)